MSLPEPVTSDPSVLAEEHRIQSAYERRAGLDARYAWTNAGHLFLVQELERAVLRRIRDEEWHLPDERILEIGCGNAFWLRQLCIWGAAPRNLTGIDLLADRIAAARAVCPPSIDLRTGNATSLKDADGRYDRVLQFTTFTSIKDPELKRALAAEMLRVLAPRGSILWYDFFRNNPRNPDVQGVGRSELQALFPGCAITVERVTLAPPLARFIARRTWTIAHLLQAIPFLRTHYLATIRRVQPASSDATAGLP